MLLPMGKTLQRYFLAEIGGAFLAGLAIFTFVLFIQRVIDLIDMVLTRGVPGYLVGKLFVTILPSFLEITIPMALLLGVVVAFGRLASDGELVALRAAGVNIFQMMRPVLVFATGVAIVTLSLAVSVRPWAFRELRFTLYEIAKTRATAALRPRRFNTDFKGMVIYVDRLDPEGGLLEGVMLADERDSFRRTTVFADSGRVVSDEVSQTLYLHLLDGTSIAFEAGQESYDWTDFASLEVHLDSEQQAIGPRPGVTEPREMRWDDLMRARDARLQAGGPAIGEILEIHRKMAISMASLVLAIIAVPLGMQPSRSVRARGLGVSLAVIVLYYILLAGAEFAARAALMHPGLAMWIPNGVMLVAGGWLFYRAARERLLYPSFAVARRARPRRQTEGKP